jgi:probable blue pigment (indigoidine) exporter
MNIKGSTAATAGATLLAPISWGTTYVTVTELLPAGRPLLVAAMRIAPSSLALLVAGRFVSRWRPRGSAEWGRTALLATCNFGVFFPLLIVAVYRLPGGVAAAFGGLQPLLVAALSWLVAGSRPRARDLVVGVVALVGVGLVALRPGAGFDEVGLLAAVGANVSFALGVVLTKRFPAPPNRLAATGWQLALGGLVLVPLTLLVEGVPPRLSGANVAGFAYLSLAATALAFVLWFNGIRRLPTAAPPLLGLAAPVTGATLGWALLGQSLAPIQLVGFAITISAIAYATTLTPLRRSLTEVGPHGARNGQRAATPVPSRCGGLVGTEPVAPVRRRDRDDLAPLAAAQPPAPGHGAPGRAGVELRPSFPSRRRRRPPSALCTPGGAEQRPGSQSAGGDGVGERGAGGEAHQAELVAHGGLGDFDRVAVLAEQGDEGLVVGIGAGEPGGGAVEGGVDRGQGGDAVAGGLGRGQEERRAQRRPQLLVRGVQVGPVVVGITRERVLGRGVDLVGGGDHGHVGVEPPILEADPVLAVGGLLGLAPLVPAP